NATPVYVYVGTDNKISSTGTFDATGQPVLFMPGRTDFEVPFGGSPVKWDLRTYDGNSKLLMTATATTTSPTCTSLTSGRTAGAATTEEGLSTSETSPVSSQRGNSSETRQEKTLPSVNLFPNPASSSVTVHLPGEVIVPRGVVLTDMNGR